MQSQKVGHLKVEDERKLKTGEMRILQMISGKILIAKKQNNEKIFEITSVERLEVFLREQRLQSADVALPPGLFHYILTNAKYIPYGLENLYKTSIGHLYR